MPSPTRRPRFAGAQEGSTLGAFLAYLSAAEEEEFGLEGGRVGETDSVKLATVHAAKGLQWPAVIVPGLSGGAQSRVFPARPRVHHPVDREPAAAAVQPARRRRRPARRWPGCPPASWPPSPRPAPAGSWPRNAAWPTSPPPGPRSGWAARATGGATAVPPRAVRVPGRGPRRLPGRRRDVVAVWAAEPEPGRRQPGAGRARDRAWPAEQRRRPPASAAVRAAAGLVDEAIAELDRRPRRARRRARSGCRRPVRGRRPAPGADRLLGQRGRRCCWPSGARRRGGWPRPGRRCPASCPSPPWSPWPGIPAELARQVRRPMPRPPAPHALRGTEFHRWLEERFGQPQLIDADELPGAADDLDGTEPDAGAGRPQGRASRPASGPTASPPRSRCRSRP